MAREIASLRSQRRGGSWLVTVFSSSRAGRRGDLGIVAWLERLLHFVRKDGVGVGSCIVFSSSRAGRRGDLGIVAWLERLLHSVRKDGVGIGS